MIQLLIPTFDDKINFIGNVTLEVNDIIQYDDYNKICKLLPGTPCGYCNSIATIGETKQPIEITRFYDIRQKGVKKLKRYFITLK